MPSYLNCLSVLLGRVVVESELMSIQSSRERTLALRETSVAYPSEYRLPGRFSELSQGGIDRLISGLVDATSQKVSVWMELSGICGDSPLVPLQSICFDFEFDFLTEGIFCITTADCRNHLVIDWEEDQSGQQVFELSVQGEKWGNPELARKYGMYRFS